MGSSDARSAIKRQVDRLTLGGPNELQFENAVLRDMYESRRVRLPDGGSRPLDTVVSAPHANTLYRMARQRRPRVALEIGMAYAASTLAVLTALAENGDDARLVSVDPLQSTEFAEIGMHNVVRSGFEANHRLVEEPSHFALPGLLRERTVIELAYIDGMHTFDYTLLDLFYVDKMLAVGGVVGFNDSFLPLVRQVLRFVKSHAAPARSTPAWRPTMRHAT